MARNDRLLTWIVVLGLVVAGCGSGSGPHPVDFDWRPKRLDVGPLELEARWHSPVPCATLLRFRQSGSKKWSVNPGTAKPSLSHRILLRIPKAGTYRLQFGLAAAQWSRSITVRVPATVKVQKLDWDRPGRGRLRLRCSTNVGLQGTITGRIKKIGVEAALKKGWLRDHEVILESCPGDASVEALRLKAESIGGSSVDLDLGRIPAPGEELLQSLREFDWERAVAHARAQVELQGEKARCWGNRKRSARLERRLDEVLRWVRLPSGRIRPVPAGALHLLSALHVLELFNLTSEFYGHRAPYLQAREIFRAWLPSSLHSLYKGSPKAVVPIMDYERAPNLAPMNTDNLATIRTIASVVSPGVPLKDVAVFDTPPIGAEQLKRACQLVFEIRRQDYPHAFRIGLNDRVDLMVVNRGSLKDARTYDQYFSLAATRAKWEEIHPRQKWYLKVPAGVLVVGPNRLTLRCYALARFKTVLAILGLIRLEFYDES